MRLATRLNFIVETLTLTLTPNLAVVVTVAALLAALTR